MTIKSLSLITATLLLTTNIHAEEDIGEITVVSTNKTAQSISKTTSDITVITAEDMEEKGYQTVAQAISTQAGIQVAQSGGLGQPTSFFMRGMDSGQVLVMIDGMRLNDPSTTNGTALLDALTTTNIEQIEIVQGGSSAIWGSNASAGVINIITKAPKEGIHGSLGLSYGSYNTKGIDADLSYKDEKFSAQILGSYLDSDSFSALAPRDAEEDGYENKNGNIKLGYAFNENNKLRLSYNRYKTKTDYDDSYSFAQADDDFSHATSEQTNYALDYDFSYNNYTALFQASKGKYEREYFTTGFFGDGVNMYKATLKEYSLINKYDYSVGKVVLGLEYKDIDGFNQFNDYPASEAAYTNKAVYISNIYNINDRTLLETNLRYDNYDEFDNKTTYKLGLKHNYKFVEGFITSANYYTSYDAPSSYQLANTAFGTFLKPSYTTGFDVTASYKKLITISYFNNKVEDYVDYDNTAFGYYNVDGESKFSGIEVSSLTDLPDNFSHINFPTQKYIMFSHRARKKFGSAPLNFHVLNPRQKFQKSVRIFYTFIFS